MLRSRSASLTLIATLMTVSTALVACGGDGGGTGGGGGDTTSSNATTSSTGGTTSSTSSTTSSTSSTTTSSSSGMCTTGRTITGTVTYTGAVGANDVLRVAAVKDGMPGIPAGFNQYQAPTFPLQYEITSLPVDMTAGYTNYGIIAYLDVGGNNFMGPGAEDPQYVSTTLIKVTACEGGMQDLTLALKP